jgi:hypothetical protein
MVGWESWERSVNKGNTMGYKMELGAAKLGGLGM